MDRYFYDWVESAQSHPNIEVTLWGYGFPGYNSTQNITENRNLYIPYIKFYFK